MTLVKAKTLDLKGTQNQLAPLLAKLSEVRARRSLKAGDGQMRLKGPGLGREAKSFLYGQVNLFFQGQKLWGRGQARPQRPSGKETQTYRLEGEFPPLNLGQSLAQGLQAL
jgi:hypothetical protein